MSRMMHIKNNTTQHKASPEKMVGLINYYCVYHKKGWWGRNDIFRGNLP